MTGLPTLKVEVEFTAGVWTDLSSSVSLASAEIVCSRGRSGRSDDGQAGVFSCVFENLSGDLTPDNPVGAYYPNVVDGKRLRFTAGGVVRFLGWITSWDPDIESTGQSSVAVSATDSLGALARSPMRSMLEHEVMADAPLWYFPLTDPAAATKFTNLGSATADLSIRTFDITATPVAYTLEVAGSTGPADDQPSPKFSPAEGLGTGRYFEAPFSHGSPTESLFECWVNPSMSAAELYALGTEMSAAWLYSAPGGQMWFEMSALGYPQLQVADSSTFTLVHQHPMSVDTWYHLAAHQSVSGTTNTVTLYVNGEAADGTSSGTLTGSATVLAANTITIGQALNADFWTGSVAHVSYIEGTGLAARIPVHYQAARGGIVETSSARLSRLCGYFGLTSSGSGGKSQGAQRTANRKALDVVQEMARGDSPILYDASGVVTARWAASSNPTTVSVTLDAEADVDGVPQWSRAALARAAYVNATSPTGGSGLAQDTDAPFDVTRSVESALATQRGLDELASREVSAARDAGLRLSRLVVDLVTAQNSISSSVLGLVLGDRVRVSNLPSDMTGWTYQDGYLLGMTERVSIGAYRVEMDLGPADTPPDGTADDATRGRAMAGGTMTLTSSLTSSGTTVSITTSSGPTLSTSAGSYPLDLDINGERVTVASAPGGSSSPQTVTVTRGVAPSVARAHSAGESVDVWHGARAAY